MAVPLHNHTEYSGLDGLSRPIEIAERCKAVGFDSAACTDHGLVAGHIDFFQTMQANDLKPILGLEAYQAETNRRLESKGDAFHFLLLAENDEGLKNLWALCTESHRSGYYYKPRTDWELLEEFSKGIIATSACTASLLSESVLQRMGDSVPEVRKRGLPEEPLLEPDKLIDKYLSIYGDGNFFIEIHTYDEEHQALLNIELVNLAKERGLPLVYANDAHYASPDQYELHEAVLALQMKRKLSSDDRMSHRPCLYIMDEQDIREHLIYLPQWAVDQAIENSDVIAERCNVSIPEKRNRVPIFVPDKKYKDSRDMLVSLTLAGFVKKIRQYGKDETPYLERLEYELDVITEANLVDYFLIVWDYVHWAKERMLVGPGRGSVGGSLVAYLIGITEIDPIKYNLIFERFYNPGRKGHLPDIDTDFQDDKRDLVKEYVAQKYGENYVADITTVTRMGAKQAIRDIGRVLEVPYKDCDAISAILDLTVDAGLTADWDTIEQKVGHRLKEYEDQYPQLFEWAKELHEYVRTYGVHASAVVIGDEPLDYTYPLRRAGGKDGRLVSQWDMHIAEDLGYTKMDFLGLRNLSTLGEYERILEERGLDPVDWEAIQYMDHPEEMWQLLDKGFTIGLFQVEDGSTARQLAREIKPRSVEDLAVVVAINRPGPLRGGEDGSESTYHRYMKGRATGKWKATHKILNDILGETYGVFIYQEQIIRYVQKIGYSPEEADEFRAIMGKKKRELMEEEKVRYLKHAHEHLDESASEAIWAEIENFSLYGFNKSHAVGYGLILLQSLFAKWLHEDIFILAGLRTVPKDMKELWLHEAQRMGIEILPPDVNSSSIQTELIEGKILFGLADIKGMGVSHGRWIVENRPFSSYDDFMEKTQDETRKNTLPSGIKRIVIDKARAAALLNVGAFESIEDREISKQARIAFEEELLGVALSDDVAMVFERNKKFIEQECVPIGQISEQPEKEPFQVAGIIRQVRKRKTKDDRPFAFIKIGMDSDEIEFPVWQELLEKRGQVLIERRPVYAKLEKNKKGIHAIDVRILD